ncbi:MAG TPA: hypothetical protein VF988_00580 [Verrucomicrobiae bacterium]
MDTTKPAHPPYREKPSNALECAIVIGAVLVLLLVAVVCYVKFAAAGLLGATIPAPLHY